MFTTRSMAANDVCVRYTKCQESYLKGINNKAQQLLNHHPVIEPINEQFESDDCMSRGHLKDEIGDQLHAVLSAAGYNIYWLLGVIVKKGGAFLQTPLLRPMHGGGRVTELLRRAVRLYRARSATPVTGQGLKCIFHSYCIHLPNESTKTGNCPTHRSKSIPSIFASNLLLPSFFIHELTCVL